MKALTTLVAALAATLAAASPAAAIIDGVPDLGRHPSVGLLAYDVGDGPDALCSGAVISDRAFLTAAHCIDSFPDARWSVTLAAGAPGRPVAEPGYFPADFPFPLRVATLPAREVVVDEAHDLAVLRFAKRTFAGVRPVRIAPPRLLDRLGDTPLTLVGYGTDSEPGGDLFRGYRLTGPGRLRDSEVAGGLCYGDSGAPQLLPFTDVAVSITHDARDCSTTAAVQRLDLPEVRRFLAREAGLP